MRHRLNANLPLSAATLLLAGLFTALAGAASCGGRAAPPTSVGAATSGEIVATVDGVPIGHNQMTAEIGRGGGTARAAVERLIDFELLSRAAARSIAADTDPDVIEARNRAAVQLMLERELEPRLTKEAIPDDVLRALYQKARGVFVHPRLVEIALLSVYTGARMKDQPRAEALETARALERTVRGLPAPSPQGTPQDWKALAAQPAWHDRRVKYARLWQALDEPFPADVGRPVAALRHPGDTTPLIVAESGYHLAQFIGERPPENVTFEQARDRLREQIAERWKRSQFLEYAQAAASSHRIEAFPERFNASGD